MEVIMREQNELPLTLTPLSDEEKKRVKRLEKAGWLVLRDQTGKLICFPEGTQIFSLEYAHNKRRQDTICPNFPPESERTYLITRGWKIPEEACADPDLEACRHPQLKGQALTISEAMKQQLEMDKDHKNPL